MANDTMSENNVPDYQSQIEQIKQAGKEERRVILEKQWEQLNKVTDYLTQAVAMLPEGNSIQAVHDGIHELILQYTALLLQTTGDAGGFGEFISEKFLKPQEEAAAS